MNMICKPGDAGYIEPGSHAHKFEVIGCSEVADILGHGYRTANDLWMLKTHRAPRDEHKRIFDRGHKMEPLGAEMVREDYGRILVAEQVQYRDPARPWLIYHADGMFTKWTPLDDNGTPRDGPGWWEFKAPGTEMADKMRRDGVSQNYICQGQIGSHVASAALGRPITWGTYGFIDYNDWELVAFDMVALPDFQVKALQLIERFHDCMVRDVPPSDINPSELPPLPEACGSMVDITDPELTKLAMRLVEIMPDLSMLKKEDEAIREQMKELLSGYEQAQIPGVMKFSNKFGKPGEKIDGEGLLVYCESLCYISGTTFRRTDWVTPKAATRTFRPTPIKG